MDSEARLPRDRPIVSEVLDHTDVTAQAGRAS